jgi:hypothetical protein
MVGGKIWCMTPFLIAPRGPRIDMAACWLVASVGR